MVPNILAQKLPGPEFTVATKMDPRYLKKGEKAGLVMFGLDYAALTVSPAKEDYELKLAVCKDAHKGFSEEIEQTVSINQGIVYLRITFTRNAACQFLYSIDGRNYSNIGEPFKVREGRWIGAKIGLLAISMQKTGLKGFADLDWFRIITIQ